jgi:transposase-like protein
MIQISKTALLALKGMDVAEKARLAERIGVSSNTLYGWIRTQSDNFTKAGVMQILSEELGLTYDQLLDTKVEQPAA